MPESYGKPIVVTGFEPLDILASRCTCCCSRSAEGRCEVENQYSRVVRHEGNPAALRLLARDLRAAPVLRVARPRDSSPQSALKVHRDYAEWDAEERFSMPGVRVADPEGLPVRRGAQGRASSRGSARCSARRAPPRRPIGTCMVSPGGRLRGVLQLRSAAPRDGDAGGPGLGRLSGDPWTPGERLFAQYAHAPNALGFCGPARPTGCCVGASGETCRTVDVTAAGPRVLAAPGPTSRSSPS